MGEGRARVGVRGGGGVGEEGPGGDEEVEWGEEVAWTWGRWAVEGRGVGRRGSRSRRLSDGWGPFGNVVREGAGPWCCPGVAYHSFLFACGCLGGLRASYGAWGSVWTGDHAQLCKKLCA